MTYIPEGSPACAVYWPVVRPGCTDHLAMEGLDSANRVGSANNGIMALCYRPKHPLTDVDRFSTASQIMSKLLFLKIGAEYAPLRASVVGQT